MLLIGISCQVPSFVGWNMQVKYDRLAQGYHDTYAR